MTANIPELTRLATEAEQELVERILPFWVTLTVDPVYGGFLGRIDGNLKPVEAAPKAAVLNTRILWAFSAAYRSLGDQQCLDLARRARDYLRDHFADPETGGIYWMLDHAGSPLNPKKQVYAQAFAIYSLVEFHRASGEKSALGWAREIYRLIEEHAFDKDQGGYFEAFSQDWERLQDVRLSEKDANEQKTMNTHLHILEAYTTLYRSWRNTGLRRQLENLTRLFLSRFIDERTDHLHLFFDERWNLRSRITSFGHDIECSWLLVEAAESLEIPTLLEVVRGKAMAMVQATLRDGLDGDGSLLYEMVDGEIDRDRHWWPQAEAVVALVNAFQISDDVSYLRTARRIWDYIRKYLVDQRSGEWFFRVSEAGVPYGCEDIAGPWKGPYHNSRACLEVMRRASGQSQTDTDER